MEFGGEVKHGGKGVPVWLCNSVKPAINAAGPPRTIRLGHHVKRRRTWRVGPADNTCSFQRAEFGLGDFQLVRIQAAGLGKNRPAGGFNKMADAVAWPWSTLSIADDARERCQKRADRRKDVRYGRGKPGWGGGNSATDRLQGIGEQNGSGKRIHQQVMSGQKNRYLGWVWKQRQG